MSKKLAFDAIIWLIQASGFQRQLRVNFMGGEPLLRFDLIKELVPFAKRRACYHGKNIHFSITTNNTLVTDDIVAFWKEWGMGFHCSIDGIPAIQNKNRPLLGGLGSSDFAEAGIRKILAYQPSACARCTITPQNVFCLLDNYHYFKQLGFVDIALVCCDATEWTEDSIAILFVELKKVVNEWMEDMRCGRFIQLKYIDDFMKKMQHKTARSSVACGAGRGMVLIGVDGSIWPCHRWNKKQNDSWRIGNIYTSFSEQARKNLDIANQTARLSAHCETCEATLFCSGGCLAENLETTGDVYDIPKEKCKIQNVWFSLAREAHDILLTEKCELFMKYYYALSK